MYFSVCQLRSTGFLYMIKGIPQDPEPLLPAGNTSDVCRYMKPLAH